MTGILAPRPIAELLTQIAVDFLGKMEVGDYDAVWNTMITTAAVRLLATAMYPVSLYREGRIDEVLRPLPHEQFSLSFDEAFSFGFQADLAQMRSSFFAGIAGAMRKRGDFDATFEKSLIVVEDSAGILIDPKPKGPLVLLFVKDGDGIFKIDFEALTLFSLYVTPSSLSAIGSQALELGLRRSAIAFLELAASFAQPYSRIKRLMLDHVLIRHLITDIRRQELLEEEKHILLARHRVLTLLSGPSAGSKPINMGRFLAEVFQGYEAISNTCLEEEDIELFAQLNDAFLRKALASILTSVNPVVALREASKPHGPHEVSDMELVTQYGDELYRLCIPVKSGREIKGETVPVNIAYQIIRPFLHFPDGVVVFVTVKPCSQHLHNYIKAANDILGLSIEVIEHHELAKLLKANGLLRVE